VGFEDEPSSILIFIVLKFMINKFNYIFVVYFSVIGTHFAVLLSKIACNNFLIQTSRNDITVKRNNNYE